MSAEPTVLVDFATAPRWVAWRNEMRDGKIRKVPYYAPNRQAEADDASTWLPHDQAALIADLPPLLVVVDSGRRRWQNRAAHRSTHFPRHREWERTFLDGLPRLPRLTPKQQESLDRIVTKLRVSGYPV